ncbi:MAG TPA: hypothetical protein VKB07_06250 [Gaiellaceae bacterium]|nr:hypothetical protein [Gaiellaceae bacterium]
MKAGAAALVVGALALGLASPTHTGSGTERAAKRPATVLALRPVERRGIELARVERRTLAPVSTRRVLVGRSAGAWALSPDRKRVAVGVEEALGVRVLDAVKMRRLRSVATRNGQIQALAWLTPTRIVGAEVTGTFVVDPVAGRLVSARPAEGEVVSAARTRTALVLLLAPSGGIGPARLATLAADGAYRTVELSRVTAGFRYPEIDGPPGEHRVPGLAIDSAGDRAFVVGADEPIAEIDLAALAVSYHEPARPISLVGRLLTWLEPPAEAKGPLLGAVRRAVWLGNGLLAVTGEDGRPGRDGVVTQAAGLSVVDTRTWKVEAVQRAATAATMAGGTLLASAAGYPELEGIGLRGYNLDGDQRFHVFGSRAVSVLGRLDGRVFVDDGGATYAVDARTGRVARIVRQVPELLVGSMRRY